MIIFDFLIYYLTYWFEQNRDKLKWSTPLQRASYAIGLASTCVLLGLTELYQFVILKEEFAKGLTKFFFVFFGLGGMQLLDFIYNSKGRYSFITSQNFKKFDNINRNFGITISIVFLFISVLIPLLVFMTFVKFGSGKR